jgi:hypothetical protein
MKLPGGVVAILGLGLIAPTATAQQVYGNSITPKNVAAAVEDCEYRLLVEEQTCNLRMNKSNCIKEIHRHCLETFADGDGRPAAPEFTLPSISSPAESAGANPSEPED